MATIKSYSDLEQSRKLAEILPLESADYTRLGENEDNVLTRTYFESCSSELKEWIGKDKMYPCWSLAKLLGVLPKGYSLGKRTNGKYYVCMTCVKHDVIEYDNPVDACVELILKLNEFKML